MVVSVISQMLQTQTGATDDYLHEESPMRFVVRLCGRIVVRNEDGTVMTDPADTIERHLDDVMDQLIELGAQDPSIELSEDLVEFSVLVNANDPLLAIPAAGGVLRTAIHAAHGGTPDWPDAANHLAWSVSLVSAAADPVESAAATPLLV